MRTFITKVGLLGVPKGSKVIYDDGEGKDSAGKTDKLLCTVPTGGSLFFAEDELEEFDFKTGDKE